MGGEKKRSIQKQKTIRKQYTEGAPLPSSAHAPLNSDGEKTLD